MYEVLCLQLNLKWLNENHFTPKISLRMEMGGLSEKKVKINS